MADDKIQIEVSLDDSTITKSFDVIRRENQKSAKESADVFNSAFEKFHEDESKRIRDENTFRLKQIDAMRNAVTKSAKESADAYQSAFTAQSKQWGENIAASLTNKDGVKKSAKDSAAVFAEAFEKESKGFGSGFNPINIIALEAGIALFNRFKQMLGDVAQSFVNLGLEAEKVRVVNAQFEANTRQNSIATEAFNEAIQKSVAGLIDDEDALQLANNAMIRLGATAQNFPKILELSRKAAAAGYNDMTTNAELFTNAIQSGNTRQLRSLGIFVDVTKEQKKLEQQLGLTSGQLNEQQQAVANSNAILKAAQKEFGNIDANVRTFSDSLARLKVEAKNAYEAFAVSFNGAFGSAIIAAMNASSAALSGNAQQYRLAQLPAKDLATTIENLKNQQTQLQKVISERPNFAWFADYDSLLKGINNELDAALRVRAQNAKTDQQIADDQINNQKRTAEAIKLTEEQKQQAYINTLNLSNQVLQRQMAVEQQQAGLAQTAIANAGTTAERELALKQEHEANMLMIAEKGAIDRNNIAINYSDAKGFDQATRDQMELQQKQMQNQAMINEQIRFETASQGAWGAYVATAKRTMADFGNYSKTVLVQGFGSSLQAVGAALVKGENAFAAFGKSFLGVLGDIAIQAGNMFIALGIANQAIPIFGFTGIGAIAAGAALVVLGGALKALSGGGAGAGADTGGGGVSNESSAADTGFNFGQPATGGRVQPNTVINFTVNGSIMDSDDTQNRIVQLLNDAVDSKGAVIRGL